jgi:hypothetical protein
MGEMHRIQTSRPLPETHRSDAKAAVRHSCDLGGPRCFCGSSYPSAAHDRSTTDPKNPAGTNSFVEPVTIRVFKKRPPLVGARGTSAVSISVID